MPLNQVEQVEEKTAEIKAKRNEIPNPQNNLKQADIMAKLGSVFNELLKKPEVDQFFNMFKASNGEYNFDMKMLLENGKIQENLDNEENAKNQADNTIDILKKRSVEDKEPKSLELKESSEKTEKKPENVNAYGNYMSFIPGGADGGSKANPAAGNYMSFIPGGLGGKSGDASSKGKPAAPAGGNYMSFIPQGFGM